MMAGPDVPQRVFDGSRTIIEPVTGWRAINIRDLYAYRELLWVLSMRDLKVRYKQTVLGSAWAVLQPLLMMIVFSIFFGRLARIPSDGFPYPIFVYVGLLPWTFFASVVPNAANSLVTSAQLVTKVYFPRVIIPLSTVGAALVDLAVATSVLLLMMLWYGVGWTLNLLAVPLFVIGIVVAALGVGILLSALTVAYRDFRYIVPFLVQFWMFATPVAYPASLVPEQWRWLYFLNPMSGMVEGFRSAFLGRPFDVPSILLSFVVGIVLFAAGLAYFERVERRFADII
jgi:lipopolysaccharide transport system permease protein